MEEDLNMTIGEMQLEMEARDNKPFSWKEVAKIVN